MDEQTTAFLRQANLHSYIDVFRDNQIQYEHLVVLSKNEVALGKLFHIMGHQMTFLHAVENMLKQDASNDSSRTTHPSSSSLLSSSGSSVHIITGVLNADGEVSIEPFQDPETPDRFDHFLLPENNTPNEVHTECNVIKNILKQTVDGLLVLAHFETKNILDHIHRIKLAKIVIRHEFKADPQTVIAAKRFKFLADCIHKEFPESQSGPEIWYNPSKTTDNHTSPPSGKLYDQYTILNKELRKGGIRDSRRGVKRPAVEPLLIVNAHLLSTIPTCELTEEEITLRLKYLQCEIKDWETITQYWKDTIYIRYEFLRSGEGRLCQYYRKYPALKQAQGFHLLELDFRTLFPQAYGRIHTHWDPFVRKIKEQLVIENITPPAQCSDAEWLLLFAKLFKPVPIKVPKGRAWKPSKKDIADGFLCHVKTDDLAKFWEHVDERNQSKGLILQPFPMIIGPSLSSINTHHLIIDKEPTSFYSTKEVFAAAFYAYHALYCSYPVQSARLWVVIERSLFGMVNVTDSQSQALSELPDVKRLITYMKV